MIGNLTSANLVPLAAFAGYFALLLGIATVRTRRMQGMSDYVLAGRRLERQFVDHQWLDRSGPAGARL